MPLIELVHVRVSFGDKTVLRDVNLSVEPGETLVVIGRSGSGKSVMLKLMVGLLRPDGGEVLVDGESVSRLDERGLFRVREKFGFLFQGAALLDSLTVGENVGLGLVERAGITPRAAAGIVAEKLALVGMTGIEGMMPADLSGGMKKRVGLARAIAMNPAIVLYDEPTTGLDPIMADAINGLIVRLKEKLAVTSVVVTHDLTSARRIADRIAMLHEGRIVFTGPASGLENAQDPVVRQFVEGRADGPVRADGADSGVEGAA